MYIYIYIEREREREREQRTQARGVCGALGLEYPELVGRRDIT